MHYFKLFESQGCELCAERCYDSEDGEMVRIIINTPSVRLCLKLIYNDPSRTEEELTALRDNYFDAYDQAQADAHISKTLATLNESVHDQE